jgi:hypothetical protein
MVGRARRLVCNEHQRERIYSNRLTFKTPPKGALRCVREFATVPSIVIINGGTMTSTDSLILDAKQAILEEQHRRFQALQRDGRWQEAMQQFQVTLTCASDLLNHSLAILDGMLAKQRLPEPPDNLPALPDPHTT